MTDDMTPSSGEKISKAKFYIIFGAIFVVILLVATGWTIIQAKNNPDMAQAEGETAPVGEIEGNPNLAGESAMVVVVGSMNIPMLPGAGLDATGQVKAPADSVVYLVSGSLTFTDTTSWYRAALLSADFTFDDEQASAHDGLVWRATSPENEQLSFEIRPLETGQTALILVPLAAQPDPVAEVPSATKAPLTSFIPDQPPTPTLETSGEVAAALAPTLETASEAMAVPAPETTDPANLAGTEAQTAASPALSPETFTATTATTPGQIPSVDPVATEILTATAVLTTTAGTSATKTLTATEVLSETEATGLLPEGLTETAVLSASEILTATEIVSETSAAITPEPAVLPTVSPWLTQLTLMTSVTPTSAYAGMFNRLEYVLVMTGTGAVKLEITLPPEVLIDPTRLPIDTGYDETQRTIGSWVDLDTVSPYHFRFEALTDLLTRPGNVRFKTIAYPAAVVEPTIEVAEVTLLPYQKTVDLAGEAAATTNEPADP